MKLLKQIGTGELYPYTEALAARDDMEVFERHAAAPAIAEPALVATQEETPTENSGSASADDGLPPLDDAIEAFRRQASKPSRKSKANETIG